MTTLARTAYPRTAGVAGESAVRRATVLVTVVMCLVMVSEAGYGAANGGLGEVPVVAALAVLPLLYVVPATRPLWLRHRYLLLAVQAALTYLPFAWFGANWAPSGWLAGLVLLTVPSPASWFVTAILAALEAAVWSGMVVALPNQSTTLAAVWAMIAFVFDALILFGLARLADLVTAVHAARNELAEAAVTAERVGAADSLRAAIGGRLAEAAGRSAAALQAIAANPSLAREHIAATAVTAREALTEVREVAARYRDVPWPEAAPAEPGELLAPRLAQAVLVVTLCGLAVLYPAFVAVNDLGVPGGYSALVVVWTIVDAIALVILQLRHSWPSRGVARPRGWPVTLLLQAVLTYALVPATGWHAMTMCGFLAGSALLLIPGVPGLVAFAAVIASVPVLWAVKPPPVADNPGVAGRDAVPDRGERGARPAGVRADPARVAGRAAGKPARRTGPQGGGRRTAARGARHPRPPRPRPVRDRDEGRPDRQAHRPRRCQGGRGDRRARADLRHRPGRCAPGGRRGQGPAA